MSKEFLNDGGATFYTTGAGLRGVPVIVMDRSDGTIQHSRVHSNTAKKLNLDIPLDTNPAQYDTYILAGNTYSVISGDISFNVPRSKKSIHHVTVEYERGAKGNAYFYLVADPDRHEDENISWRFIHAVSFTGQGYERFPVDDLAGTARVFRWKLISILPQFSLAITHLTFDYTVDEDWA